MNNLMVNDILITAKDTQYRIIELLPTDYAVQMLDSKTDPALFGIIGTNELIKCGKWSCIRITDVIYDDLLKL